MILKMKHEKQYEDHMVLEISLNYYGIKILKNILELLKQQLG